MAHLAYELKDEAAFGRIADIFISQKRELPDKIKIWKSLFAKRAGHWEEALELWQQLSNTKEYLFFALEESAKYYEHQKKDYRSALMHTEQALNALQRLSDLNPYMAPEERVQAFLKRAQRLRLKTA